MSKLAKDTRATIIPTLRYADPDKALNFLTGVFGFDAAIVFRDDEGKLQHAQLSFGNGMIMIGPDTDTAFGRLMRQPITAGGVTAALYVVVTDADAHHARSTAAGFDIVMPLREESYGGREYSVRDPEGQIWTFGTYDPWAA